MVALVMTFEIKVPVSVFSYSAFETNNKPYVFIIIQYKLNLLTP